MNDITFGELLTVVIDDLSATLQHVTDRTQDIGLRVSDIDLDLPAHLRLRVGPERDAVSTRLMVGLPSLRETPPNGRLGRVRLTLETPRRPRSEEPR
jgi:hypothetical protein